jgi:hypothetical protein
MKNYTYPNRTITTSIISGNYLYLGVTDSVEDTCYLLKCSAFDPSIVYYELEITATEITRIMVGGLNLYLCLDDDTNLACKVVISTMVATYLTIPSGITAPSIDLINDDTYLYFLIGGSITSIILVNYSTFTFVSTLTLDESGQLVSNAKRIDIDFNGDLWIYTSNTPIDLVKVSTESGNSYEIFTIS